MKYPLATINAALDEGEKCVWGRVRKKIHVWNSFKKIVFSKHICVGGIETVEGRHALNEEILYALIWKEMLRVRTYEKQYSLPKPEAI